MMFRKTAAPTAPPTPAPARFWLTRHRDEFLRSLARQGYAGRAIKTFRRMVDRLCRAAQARGFGPDALDAAGMRELADACPRSGTPYMERELAMATRRFTDYLVNAGAIAAACPRPHPPGSPEQLCEELDHWLRHHRGMFGSRLRTCRNELQRLIAFCCTATGTVDDLADITPEAVFALCAFGLRTHRSLRPCRSGARFARPIGARALPRPEVRRGPTRCVTASPWR